MQSWRLLSWHGLLLLLAGSLPAASMSPIFGILAQPPSHNATSTFIVSSYVKWLESAGARVVPIRFGAPQCEVDFLMKRINGLVLPGGGAGTDPATGYGRFAYGVYKQATGRKIPVWGTCLGHQQIMRFACYEAGEPSPVESFPSEGVAMPLDFSAEADSSPLYQAMPESLRKSLSTSNLTINLHVKGVGSETFHKSRALASSFHLLATGVDVLGHEFVALTQHRTLPIVTAQFHIEKNAFEFGEGDYEGDDSGSASPHSPEGVFAGQWLATWLVAEARKGEFLWEQGELQDWVIWNWPSQFSHRSSNTAWEQQIVFPHQGPETGCPKSRGGTLVV